MALGLLLFSSATFAVSANTVTSNNYYGGGPSVVRCSDLSALACWAPGGNSGAAANSTRLTFENGSQVIIVLHSGFEGQGSSITFSPAFKSTPVVSLTFLADPNPPIDTIIGVPWVFTVSKTSLGIEISQNGADSVNRTYTVGWSAYGPT